MKNVIYTILCGLLSISAVQAQHQRDADAPFIILRLMNSSSENFEYVKGIVDVVKKYPNTFEEVWLCTQAFYPSIKAREDNSKNYLTKVCKLWKDIGVAPSFQVGTTLGHGNNNVNEHGFSKEAYRLRFDGNRMNPLCANSPEVRDYFYKHTLALINNAPLESVWLDDDFRIGISFSDLCFCKFCMDKFNAQENTNWNVKDLSRTLFNDDVKNASLRKSWIKMHEKSLCELANIVAKARDDASRKSILGLQSVNPLRYNCHDYPALVSAFAKGKKAGIRIGSGAYSEFNDKALFEKMLGVMFEAGRCSKQNDIYQICYEAENYPHISTIKTPRAMMLECTLMLASGCDSLALYWDDVKYPECWQTYEKFVKTAKEYRPFFVKVGNFYKDTRLWGIGRYVGETMYSKPIEVKGSKYIMSRPEEQEFDLLFSGFPVISTNPYADIVLLTENVISRLSNAQIEQVLSKNCMVDSRALTKLIARGFDFGIKAESLKAGEIFEGGFVEQHKLGIFGMYPSAPFYNIEVGSPKVQIVSDVIALPNKKIGAVFAIVDTKFGGKLLAVGGNGIFRYFSEARKSAFMDALDLLSPMPVRLETNHSMLFIPRVDSNGNFVNATIYNYTKGETDNLVLRVRSKSAQKYRFIRPKKDDVIMVSTKASDGDGYILTLPSLDPVSVCAVERVK